jgi:hypothetical protein
MDQKQRLNVLLLLLPLALALSIPSSLITIPLSDDKRPWRGPRPTVLWEVVLVCALTLLGNGVVSLMKKVFFSQSMISLCAFQSVGSWNDGIGRWVKIIGS